jgi:hypothetical protein
MELPVSAITYSGEFIITPNTRWVFAEKPNWRTRFFARWVLGWVWVDE